jgi:PLP dependent protein
VTLTSTSVAERLAGVRERIAQAALASGRSAQAVRLVAVSKFHAVSTIREAYAAGQREFGENYAQELAEKAAALADLPDLRFRFIGALQRNKAKLLVGARCAIETVSSESSAKALHERASASGLVLEVMLQVNVLGETRKAGIEPAALGALVTAVRACSALRLTGLMAIPPAGDLTLSEQCYRRLAELAREHALPELSMGMSDDLEVAVRQGATSVRVGTAIFGPRP